ncbi:MAG: baseplate J/gp47 family protein [Mucilaginibacter sp.]|nr:baseplate J/gp47 family protein [Mucilaginibacter sp.]
MSTKAIDYKVILKRDGQTQAQRMPELLNPNNVPIDPRSKEDFYKYIQNISREIKFYDLDPASKRLTDNGTWESFFDIDFDELKQLAAQAALPPHLALWNAFIELFERPKAVINTLTQRHLDFYYKDVLRLQKQPLVADKAHVVFELKKNTENTLLKAGTLLLAGKDALKKDINHKLEHDIIVNPSKVEQLKSVFVSPANKNFVYHAPIANSADGLGAVLDPVNPKWNGFGSEEYPLAQVGFCLASDILKMQEGDRTVNVTLSLKNLDEKAKNTVLTANLFKVSLTAEKGWIGPKLVSPTITSADNLVFTLNFKVNITKDEPAVVAYDKDTHGGVFDTVHPVLQIAINNEKADFGYRDLINADLIDSTIEVDVKEITSLELENDFGSINPKKPFTPFGPTSEENSNFYIKSEETFSKRLKEFSLDVDWKNIPDSNLANYFANYNMGGNTNSDFKAVAAFKDGFTWQESFQRVNIFNSANAQAKVNWKFTNPKFPVIKPYYILPPLKISTYINPGQSVQQSVTCKMSYLVPGFSQLQNKVSFIKPKAVMTMTLYQPALQLILNLYKDIRKGQLQLRLEHGFLFKQFRSAYTKEILRYNKDGGDLKLPAEPFAPEIQSISLNYTATTAKIGFSGTTINDYVGQEIEFFHYTAFGAAREHAYSRNNHTFLNNLLIKLMPQYISEGELYIGLSGLYAGDTASILIQVAEGSANPEKAKVAVTWSVLCDNYWKALTTDDIVLDTTNVLLTSGIIKILIPKEATTQNTVLPTDLLWIKATIQKDVDAVCTMVDVLSNAAVSVFEDHGNAPEHLATALPAQSINKLVKETAAIKKVTQPYSSFGGALQENDKSYYTRVSERLRHKERSVALWDYERMVLQHFPTIHKVKCINHATPTSFYSPGNTLVVVIPDLTNRNAVDPFKPKADKNTLDNIHTFLTGCSSAWANHQIINPLYEPIKVSVNLKLKKGYEFNYYQKVIDQKIKEFLSPCIYNPASEINFGGKITKSMLIKFLEDLDFIDYLTSFSLVKYSPFSKMLKYNADAVEASSPASILVSHTQHTITNN